MGFQGFDLGTAPYMVVGEKGLSENEEKSRMGNRNQVIWKQTSKGIL